LIKLHRACHCYPGLSVTSPLSIYRTAHCMGAAPPRVMPVKGEINHEQQFLSVLRWVWASSTWNHVRHGGTLYTQVSLPLQHRRRDGRESICGWVSAVALMDLCGQLNPLFVTGKIRPWPWLSGAKMILSVPGDSNWAVLCWTNWSSAPSWLLEKWGQELHGHTDSHERRQPLFFFVRSFYRVQVL